MSNDNTWKIWDKLGYKRVFLAVLLIFGIIAPCIGMIYLRIHGDFVSLPSWKLLMVASSLGVSLLVLNLLVGIIIAYKWYYKTNKSEDKIARLVLTSSITATAVDLNALLVIIYVTAIKFACAIWWAVLIDVATHLLLQFGLLKKVDLSK